jgi:hypothetical protein
METSANGQKQPKQAWTRPRLTSYGTVEEITAQDKKVGGNDGLTFLGIPIQNNS